MILPRFTYIFNLILILTIGAFAYPAMAQNLDLLEDTLQNNIDDTVLVMDSTNIPEVEVTLDSLEKRKFVSGVELVVDYGKILTMWTKFETKYEVGINIRFYERIVLAAEYGHAVLNPLKAYDNALYYTVTGPYARVGLDYYTSYNPKSFYYVGLRYGASVFKDEGAFLIDSEYWEDYEDGFGSTDVPASWVEIVLGTETYIKFSKKNPDDPKSNVLLGWKFRLRILAEFENREEPRIYSIPGYGRTFNNVTPAFNLYIKYRFGN